MVLLKFSVYSYQLETGLGRVGPRDGHCFWPPGHNLIKFKRGLLDHAIYQSSRICAVCGVTQEDVFCFF